MYIDQRFMLGTITFVFLSRAKQAYCEITYLKMFVSHYRDSVSLFNIIKMPRSLKTNGSIVQCSAVCTRSCDNRSPCAKGQRSHTPPHVGAETFVLVY